MGLRDFIERFKEKKLQFKEFETQRDIERKWSEKQKSANERELDRYLEEDRQKRIKIALESMRKKRENEFNSHKILEAENLFEDEGKPFTLQTDKKMLNGKVNMKGGMFFK